MAAASRARTSSTSRASRAATARGSRPGSPPERRNAPLDGGRAAGDSFAPMPAWQLPPATLRTLAIVILPGVVLVAALALLGVLGWGWALADITLIAGVQALLVGPRLW